METTTTSSRQIRIGDKVSLAMSGFFLGRVIAINADGSIRVSNDLSNRARNAVTLYDLSQLAIGQY